MPALVLTNSQVRTAYAAVQGLARKELAVTGALAVRRMLRELRPIVEDLTEVARGLVEKYAKRDEEGRIVPGAQPGTVIVTDANGFQQEVKALMDGTVEINSRITLEQIGEVAISGEVLDGLGDLLVLEEYAA